MHLLGGTLLIRRFATFSSAPVRSLARESLFAYFLHVCILYGSIWNAGLKQHFTGMGLANSFAIAALLITAMAALALAWNRTKKGPPIPVLAFRTAVIAVAVFSLL